MPSAGKRKRETSRGQTRYQVWWLLDDGSQGAETYRDKDEADEVLAELKRGFARGEHVDPRRGRILFDDWADQWWEMWEADPDRSPTTKAAAFSRLTNHIRPAFGGQQIRHISVTGVRRWQNQLRSIRGHETVMACRSLLYQILQAAVDDGRISSNPVAKVRAPRRPVDPDTRLGHAKLRACSTPEQVGKLLAAIPRGYWDHYLTLAGTGMRAGEFTAVRAVRVRLEPRELDVVKARYDAGRFGRGYRPPKSDAGIRTIPLCDLVAEAIGRQLPDDAPPDALVFTVPKAKGERGPLTRYQLRQVYQRALPDADLPELDLRGPHDLRHTFATWLEDGGIPARVIDELMGHEGGRRGEGHGSRVGTRYRHTTTEMLDRVRDVLNARLETALKVAEREEPAAAERRTARRAAEAAERRAKRKARAGAVGDG